MAGCILGIIFPLLQSDNLLGAYLSLMAIFLLVSLPMMRYIGVLNNLRSIGFVLIVIFTEVSVLFILLILLNAPSLSIGIAL